jgi:hypothetical protein
MDSVSVRRAETNLAAKAGEITIGSDLRITRLGFGAMRITGKGIWGESADRAGKLLLVQVCDKLYGIETHGGRIQKHCRLG